MTKWKFSKKILKVSIRHKNLQFSVLKCKDVCIPKIRMKIFTYTIYYRIDQHLFSVSVLSWRSAFYLHRFYLSADKFCYVSNSLIFINVSDLSSKSTCSFLTDVLATLGPTRLCPTSWNFRAIQFDYHAIAETMLYSCFPSMLKWHLSLYSADHWLMFWLDWQLFELVLKPFPKYRTIQQTRHRKPQIFHFWFSWNRRWSSLVHHL